VGVQLAGLALVRPAALALAAPALADRALL
jgi:hypothetical protein